MRNSNVVEEKSNEQKGKERADLISESSTSIVSSSSSQLAVSTVVLSEEDLLTRYRERLDLLRESSYREYTDAFLSTLCASREVADVVISGKFQLAEPKRQQVLSYATSILCDAGAAFVPTGTIQRAINDVSSYFFDKARTKGYQQVTEIAANPMHFILFSQALVDCLLFYFEPSWLENRDPKFTPKKAGKELAGEVVRAIKRKKLLFSEDMNLAKRLEHCLEYIVRKELIKAFLQDEGTWVKGRCEIILLLATEQTLGLRPGCLTDLDAFAKRLEQLENDLRNAPNQEGKKKIYTSFLEEGAKITGGSIPEGVDIKGFEIIAVRGDSREQREIDAEFARKVQADEIHTRFLGKNAELKDTNIAHVRITGQSISFIGDKQEPKVEEEKPQVSPSHSSSSLFHSPNQLSQAVSNQFSNQKETRANVSDQSQTFSKYVPRQPPHQKKLVAQAENLIKGVYAGEDFQEEKEEELNSLDRFRGRRLSKEEEQELRDRVNELRDDLNQSISNFSEKQETVAPSMYS